jgi:outer membrane protein assembly factor BamB
MKIKIISYLSLIILFGSVALAQVAPSLDPCATGPTRSSSADWPQFHFNPCHSGYNPYEFILSPDNVANLVPLWIAGYRYPYFSSPAVANGVVYDGSGTSVYALNAGTGALIWQYSTGSQVHSSPAVAYGIVYVGLYDDSNVYALNAGTGALIWKYRTGSPVDSSPAVASGVLYIGSEDYNVYALKADTGALI